MKQRIGAFCSNRLPRRYGLGIVVLSIVALAFSGLLGAAPPSRSPDQAPGSSVAAQPGEPPQAGQHDESRPLRDIPPIPPQARERIEEVNERRETTHIAPRSQGADPVRQATTGGAAMPSASGNFEGVGNLDGVYPPDTNGRAGPTHYVQWVNLHFQIFNKDGTSAYGPAAGNTLWSGFGGPCATQNSGDPIVLYDRAADRWVMAQFTSSSPYGECVAVSTTGDPTGSYYRYFFQFSTSVFYDYPHLGVWPDGYYMGANRFNCFVTCNFQGPSAIVFDRAKMLIGQAATYREFQLGTSYGTVLPADLDGATAPPPGSPSFFAEIGGTALHLWKFHIDWTNPANSTFTGPSSLPVTAYNVLCSGTRSCVPQPGTNVGLDGLGDRLMHRLAYRNLGDHESLVVAHNVNAASSGVQAGVRWYEIRNPSGSPSIYQQGTFAPSDGVHRWLGSIAMDQGGNIALGYSVSNGSNVYPGIRYTGRLAGDPLGQMTQGETTLIAGSGSQTGSASRWGDYAAMALDPTDDCTFWFTTEYMPATGPAPWHTRVGSFKFSACGSGVSPTATPTLTATPTPTLTVTPTSTSGTPGTTVPSAPQNLNAKPSNGRGVDLSWGAASNNGSAITNYKVYRGEAAGAEALLTTVGNVTSYKDTATVRGRTYYYKVTAVNSVGEGPASNEASTSAK